MKELQLAKATEDMIEWAYQGALPHFPKSERHVLSQEIRATMWQVLRLAVTVGKRYHKKTTLQQIDIELEVLRRMIRLAHARKMISTRKYEHWAKLVNVVGQIVGGWIRSVQSKGQA